jgi:rare lipoprotein A
VTNQPAETAPAKAQLEPRGRPVSSEIGLASWYGPPYTNRKAADGSIYDQNAMTAAHRELPMGSIVRVTNLANGESVIVRITDRGPFVDGRILDLSLAAAKAIDVYRPGTAKVRVEAFAPPPGSDPAGHWCVQVGAFLDEGDAIQLKNDLTRRYATAKVIEFAGPTGHWVRINPKYPDKATARQIADGIHIPDPGAQPYLVRLD